MARVMPLPSASAGHRNGGRLAALARRWPLLLPVLLYAASGLAVLATNYWSTEQGGQGPIILLTGLWLLWSKADGIATAPPIALRTGLAVLGIALFGLASLVAAATVKQFLQVASIYSALVCLLWSQVGGAGLRRLWAPLAYLAFLIPPPENITIALTHALKGHIASASVTLLAWLHYPVAREGGTLFIGSYALVVAAACSGLNSLFSLVAIGLFYVFYLHPADWRYSLVLSALLVPIAIFANFVRVVAILLVTYYFGDAVGQGFVHDTLGLIVFGVALATLMIIDLALQPLFTRPGLSA